MNIRVAFEVSILGRGYINAKSRTGIFRVVESLITELIDIKSLHLSTISFHGLSHAWDYLSTTLYLRENLPALGYNFENHLLNRSRLKYLYQFIIYWQNYCLNNLSNSNPLIYKVNQLVEILSQLVSPSMELEINNKNFDIYHATFYPLPSSSVLPKAQKLITIYDLIPIKFSTFFKPKARDLFLKIIGSINVKDDWVICISQNTKQDFCQYSKMNPDRVFVTALAAGKHFYPTTDLKIITDTCQRYGVPDAPYLLSLCTLEPRKNLAFLIRCFSQIIAARPSLEIYLVLVGVSGWKNRDIFKALKDNPTVRSRIIFTGYIPDADLSAIYSGATAFVYPSLYEGFGLPPLEAMQCGTPVITSNTSSLPEVVGDAGIMVDPKKEDELCQALLNIINDSQLRKILSQKGLERASQFSWKRCAEETVKIYQIAAANRQ